MYSCFVIPVCIQDFKIPFAGRGQDSDCDYVYTDKSFSPVLWLSVPIIIYTACLLLIPMVS